MDIPFDLSLIPKDGLQKDAKEHVADLKRRLQIIKRLLLRYTLFLNQIKFMIWTICAFKLQKRSLQKTSKTHKLAKRGTTTRIRTIHIFDSQTRYSYSPKVYQKDFHQSCNHHGTVLSTSLHKDQRTHTKSVGDTHKELKSPIHANRLKSFYEHIPENNDSAPAVVGTPAVVHRPSDALSQDAQDPVASTQQTTQDIKR